MKRIIAGLVIAGLTGLGMATGFITADGHEGFSAGTDTTYCSVDAGAYYFGFSCEHAH